MLGILLNTLKSATKITHDLSILYNPRQNFFGLGVVPDTVSLGSGVTTNETLYNTYHSLEFTNLTVPSGAILKPTLTAYGDWGNGAARTPFSVLMLKCSDTLTVEGEITSTGCGGRNERYHNTTRTYQSWCPTGILYPNAGGFSAAFGMCERLYQYGMNRTFFDNETFIYGAGGGGGHRYVRGRLGRHHNDHFYNYGFTCGGFPEGNNNTTRGAGGGFVAIYFEKLTINGKEYGKDSDCDLSSISANGGYLGIEGAREAGGSIVIAARNIVINGGSINSNAITSGNNYKYSFLNNYPQLCYGQNGYYIDRQTGDLVYETSANRRSVAESNKYTYATGTVDQNGKPNIYTVQGSSSNLLGGAGIALGYKVVL